MADLQTGTLGAFGVYPQVSLGTAPSSVEYQWFRGNLFDIGPQQIMREIGQLVGSDLISGGQIKTGVFSGGRMVMPPALDDDFWWLLYAFAGAQDTPDDNSNGTYTHWAPSKTLGDAGPVTKVLAAHKMLPISGGTKHGEEYLDQTITRMQFGIVGGEYMTFQADLLGKRPTVTSPASGTGWTPAPKGKRSIPIAAIPAGGVELPINTSLALAQAITIDMVNVTPAFRDVATVGSYDPHSCPVLHRAIVISVSVLVTGADMYQHTFFDGAGNWNPEVYNTDFKVRTQSAALVRSSLDTEQGALSYTDESGDPSITDAGQDFGDYDVTSPGTATHWIEVINTDGSKNWGYLGDSPSATEIQVFQDSGLVAVGWNGPGATGKTPTSYNVYPNARYEFGFQAKSVDWQSPPPPLQGGELMRLDMTGTVANAESGIDWNMWVTNKTPSYTWPT